MIKLGIIVAAAVLAFVLFRRVGKTSSEDAHRLVKDGALLLDVRTQAEFSERHLPQAVNIPVQELDQRMAELESKQRPIVVYCRSGHRSGQATRMLEAAGFSAVHDLGAMGHW
jgi:phage shock protein E